MAAKKIKLNKKKITARRAKIKTIKLKLGHYSSCMILNGNYESIKPSFAVCTNINEGEVELLSNFTGCRETLATMIRNIVNKTGSYTESHESFPVNKTCILALINVGSSYHDRKVLAPNGRGRLDVTYEEWVPKIFKTGLKLVNHYEKTNKWLLTKLYKVDYKTPTNHSTTHIIYCFIGSRWWMNSPQSLYLFTLLIRLGRYSELQLIGDKSSRETVSDILAKVKNMGSKEGFVDNDRISVHKWNVFLDNYKKIYKGRRKVNLNWGPDICPWQGIQSLTNGTCSDAILQARFNKILVDSLNSR